MDAGPVAFVVRTPIEPRENTAELSNRLSLIAATAIEETVEKIAREDIEWTAQDESLVTIAPKLEKSDALLDLHQGAPALACRIHALSPKPGGMLTVVSAGGEAVLKISRADTLPFDASSQPTPGTIERDAFPDLALRIATGEGWLVPLVMQRAGGKALPIADFLRGFDLGEDASCALPNLERGAAE